MEASIDKDCKKIIRDIKKRLKKAAELTAEEITFQIQSAYESVIQQFYEDYLPMFYERTYSTYMASNRWDNPFYVHNDGDYLIGGIKVSSNFIPGNPYKAQKGWVFHRTFDLGIHGIDLTSEYAKHKKDIAAMTNFVLYGKKGDWSSISKSVSNVTSVFKFKSKFLRTKDLKTNQSYSQEDIAINREIYNFVYGDSEPKTTGFTYTAHKKREKFYKYAKIKIPKQSTAPKKNMDKIYQKIINKWHVGQVYKEKINQVF